MDKYDYEYELNKLEGWFESEIFKQNEIIDNLHNEIDKLKDKEKKNRLDNIVTHKNIGKLNHNIKILLTRVEELENIIHYGPNSKSMEEAKKNFNENKNKINKI